MIDLGLAIYVLLLTAMLGLAAFADARRRARKRISDAAGYSRKSSL